MNKELMYEKYDIEFNLKLADEFGVDVDDLEQLDYEFITIENNDGLTCSIFAKFKDTSSIDILRKIFGDDTQNKYIELDLSLFND